MGRFKGTLHPLKPPLSLPLSLSTPALQIAVTFAIVLGVIIYRISTAAALAMNSSPSVRSNIRVTVTATAVIINLVVIILLDEVYGCIARWLTKIGEYRVRDGMGSMALLMQGQPWSKWLGHQALAGPHCPWPDLPVSGYCVFPQRSRRQRRASRRG